MKYNEKDVPKFKEEICLECHCYNSCIDKNDKNFLMCPKFFNWKIGYTNYIIEQMREERKHPENYKTIVDIDNETKEKKKAKSTTKKKNTTKSKKKTSEK